MAFDYQERKLPLSYADLFKVHKKTVVETEQKQGNNTFYSQLENGSSSGSSSNLFNSSFCDSSSGFSTPFEYELGSSESEDVDFMSELTRQIAECMLDEDEDEETGPILDSTSEDSEVYQLKNQPRVSENSPAPRVGRLNGTELAQSILNTTEQPYMQYRVRHWGMGKGGKGNHGSGMQAVFLGGSGSKNASGGTGVFLPRVTNDPSELKKKQGCSTVLIPTRVLQTLQQLSNGRPNSAATLLNGRRASSTQCYSKVESTRSGGQELKNRPTNHEDLEIQLPQEWTY